MAYLEFDPNTKEFFIDGENLGKIQSFEVTGTATHGERFKTKHPANGGSFFHWKCINVHRGTKWVRLESGKRKKVSVIYN